MKKLFAFIWIFVFLFSFLYFTPVNSVNAVTLGCGWNPVKSTNLQSRLVLALAFNSSNGTLFAGASHYLYKSIDGGDSWAKVANLKGTIRAILVEYAQNKKMLVGTDNGIFKSDDYGATWTSVLKAHVQLFAEDEKIPKVIFAGTYQGLYKSEDYGAHWDKVFYSGKTIYSVAIDSGRGIVYLATKGGLYKSYDLGSKWVKTPLSGSVYSVAVNPVNASIVFAGCAGKIYKSTDGGAHWTQIESENLPKGHYFNFIKFQPHSGSIMYAVAQYTGIFKSLDNGKTWIDISNVLPRGRSIYTFTINPLNASIIYTSVSTTLYKWSCDKIVITLKPDNPMMSVNGLKQEIDPGRGTKPIIIPKWSRTVVPIRAIVEALGGAIGWNGSERKVTIDFNGTEVELWIDKPQAKVNGEMKLIDSNNHDVRPIIVNSRTMLPLRFVAESLGCKVDWNGSTRTITITYTP